MPDALTITLPAPLADEVRAAAEARGLSPEEYVRQSLAMDIALGDNTAAFVEDSVAEDEAAFAEFESTGIGVPWEEVRDWMKSWGTVKELPRPTPRKLR